ncbi:serine/threonine dehydratase [Thermobifida halotolerans]|uniref:Serine/threonine dehydratase n=1 Tax=Thermobifida halotolerans TaxID=483545 RepID=A0A399G6A7_9ACTN|nr:serine/threonine dehydratase [Thermobifida halotolerans]UOE21521.1 serine/threonine dehydratase [Thermobifida halotolerans]
MTSSITVPRPVPTALDVRLAAERTAPHLRRTPLLRAELRGRPLLLKLEHLQTTGAFKLRGALNALLARDSGGRVVTASGGNHGLGVATAARMLGARATVYVPETVPEVKERRLREAGAEIVRAGADYATAAAAAREYAEAEGVRYLHAYDDPDVVAGQGTLGYEIAADAPDCDAVAVAVGGGGLVAGVSLGIGEERTAVAVEPHGCASLHAALAAGGPVDAPVDSVASSALGASRVGDVPFAVLRGRRLATALVSDTEILAARDLLWEEFRIAAEPAAAAPMAAWLAGRVPGELPCVVVCGANADWRPVD